MANRGLSRGDRTHIIYRGTEGDRFWLAGMRGQGKQGVELAPGIVGLDRPPTELVWLQEAHQNGADLVGSNVDVRTIKGAVNILGKNPRHWRDRYACWQRNNQFDRLGRMYFINSYSGYRYCDVLTGEAPNASIEKDPALRRGIAAYPWTWVAPNPYYKGLTEEFEWQVTPADSLGVSVMRTKVRSLGDADSYPVIELPGPGIWTIPMGIREPLPHEDHRGLRSRGPIDMRHTITFDRIEAGQKIVLNTDPRIETIDRVSSTGITTNLWAKLEGKRPRIRVLGSASEEWEFSVKDGTPGAKAKMIVTPLYSTFC